MSSRTYRRPFPTHPFSAYTGTIHNPFFMKTEKILTATLTLAVILIAGCATPFTAPPQNTNTPQNNTTTPPTTDTTLNPPNNTTVDTPIKTDDVRYNTLPVMIDRAAIDKNPVDPKGYISTAAFFDVGTIQKEPYKGWTLILLDGGCDGMCFRSTMYHLAWNKQSGKVVMFSKYSDPNPYNDANINSLQFTIDATFTLESLNNPDTIQIPNSKYSLKLREVRDSEAFRYNNETKLVTKDTALKVAFKDAIVGNVYFIENFGCYYIMTPDGIYAKYELETKFFAGNGATITWDGTSKTSKLNETYTYPPHGCGINGGCYFTEDKIEMKNLKKVGTTDYGFSLYISKNPQESATVERKGGETEDQSALVSAYESYKQKFEYSDDYKGKTALGFNEFVATNPILYFQDPFGRFGSIMSREAVPAAECGKPVIYLYPEKTTDVNVQVGIEKLTETIPAYGRKGWTVSAKPDGTLYNYDDKKSYPYLYWEGTTKEGVEAKKGFMVARNDIETFLNTSLTKLGLNATEQKDFKEFWVSRMLDNKEPYFFISFVGTKDFNTIAPLTITPSPDTLIRIFMTYIPVREAFKVEPLELKSIPRKGFTVVEWGGTSSRPWKK